VTPAVPASILRTHTNTTVYLDAGSAAHLSPAARGALLEHDRS
jgi:6-phosphogluconolactonase/glucosamine-6-phosphate isomerase/deaminase